MNHIKDDRENNCETIELTIPFSAEYVGTARLTASSIAHKIGFDIDDIEDIKVSMSEVCNKFVKNGSEKVSNYRIIFKIYSEKLSMMFFCEDDSLKCIFNEETDAYGIAIMKALMDEAELCTKDGYLVLLSKVLKGEK